MISKGTSREAINWIKSEEARGLSDIKVKEILVRQGWSEKEADLAINLAHKKKVNWMPVLVVFGVSLVLFSVFFAFTLKEGEFDGETIVFVVFAILALLAYSFIYYHKTDRKESFVQFFVVNFSGASLSAFLSVFLFNLEVLIIYLLGIPVKLVTIVIAASLPIIFFFYAYYLSVEKLSKHFQGYFDAEAYLKYKHWPFKLFNVNWEKKWTLLKYPLIIIVIGLVVGGGMYYSEIRKSNMQIHETTSIVQMQLRQQLSVDCSKEMEKHENITIIDAEIFPVKKTDKGYLYNKDGFKNIDVIRYDCNYTSFSCKYRPFDPSQKLEEQVEFKEGVQAIGVVTTPNQVILQLPNELPPEELVNCPFFSEEQLKLKVVQEINKERKDQYLEIFHKEFPIVTWSNYVDIITDTMVYFNELGLDLGYARTTQQVISNEFEFIGAEKEGIMYYDGTSTTSEHVEKLNKNINQLYPQSLAIPQIETILDLSLEEGLGEPQYYSYEGILSVSISLDYLLSELVNRRDFAEKLATLRNNFNKDKIKVLYDTKDIAESPESKAVRLKIIETMLAKELAQNCKSSQQTNQWDKEKYDNCVAGIIDITHSPELLQEYMR